MVFYDKLRLLLGIRFFIFSHIFIHEGGIIGHNGVLREEEPGGIGRGVRRIPHPARGSSGPRTRRPNMHFS